MTKEKKINSVISGLVGLWGKKGTTDGWINIGRVGEGFGVEYRYCGLPAIATVRSLFFFANRGINLYTALYSNTSLNIFHKDASLF